MKLLPLDSLKSTFSGKIILPSDAEYEATRNSLFKKGSPAIILQPKTADDVRTAVQFATKNSLLLSVRSGGHSAAGFSTNENGLVIDLSLMRKVEIIDKAKNKVKIEAGASWYDAATTLKPLHLAISSGDTKTVGVGGLTLGGGVGWLVRKHGLTIDHLVAAEVVTAEGKIIRTSATEEPDLFWAIRGGGGNFGVVTSFEFIAQPIGDVFAGHITYGTEHTAEILKGWRDCMRSADESFSSILTILPSFGGNPPAIMISCCYASDDEKTAMEAIDPLLHLGKLVSQNISRKAYVDVLEDAHPPGVRIVVKNVFTEKLSDEMIEAIISAQKKKTDFILQIRSLGGAMNRVASDATAFPHRSSEALLICPHFLPANATDEQIKEAVKPWEAISAFGKGAYSNFVSDATQKEIQEMYLGTTYKRLQKIKTMYDPKNIFSQNYNVAQATLSSS